MRPLVVKLTAGADEPERVSQAFTVAATALASGSATSLWLTGRRPARLPWRGWRRSDSNMPRTWPISATL